MRYLPALSLATLLLLPGALGAQSVDPGIQGSWDVDGAAGDGAFGLGARATFDPTGGALRLQGTADWFFADPVDYWTVAANLLWEVSILPAGLEGYVGAGVGHLSFDDDDALAALGNDQHLQLLAGTAFGMAGRLSPFVEVRYQFRGDPIDDAVVVAAGVTF